MTKQDFLEIQSNVFWQSSFLHEQTLKDVCIKQTCEINRYICTQLWADI